MVRLEFPIDSGMKGVPATEYVSARNLRAEELEGLQGADADTIMAVCTGLSLDQVARLTAQDRAAIIVARRSIT
ncbi:hypothetical protein DLM45_13225 [Hyphomicrobium methylovorum]|nr:hypothetical protein [Hyphomicrobium methylovorum]